MIVQVKIGVKTINIVQDVKKKDLLQSNDYSMIVYSVKKEDTLWNIAKKFRVKQANIIQSNNHTTYSLGHPMNLQNPF